MEPMGILLLNPLTPLPTGPRLPCTADDACKKQLPSEDMMQPQILHSVWGDERGGPGTPS